MKIGILITDTVREELISEHGDYPDMFEDLMAGVDRSIEFTRFYVQSKIPQSVDCDGYLVTGSRHSVYDELPWIESLVNFIKEVLASRRKIIGVCFGHQLMAHYFGGHVEKSAKGWAVGVHKSNIVARQSWMDMADSRQDVSLLSSHQDQVIRMPEEATLYATNDFCPIAGFVVGDHQRRALQFPDDIGHGEGLSGSGDAQQHLVFLLFFNTLDQFLDRLGLVTPGAVIRFKQKGNVLGHFHESINSCGHSIRSSG